MKFKKKILCIGAGYVGGPSMAMIACKCPDCRLTRLSRFGTAETSNHLNLLIPIMKGRHYIMDAEAATVSAVIRGGGCLGNSKPSWCSNNF